MRAPAGLEHASGLRGFVPVVLANLLPLVGVLRLGWDPATLVVIYTLELLFSFVFAGAKALFAQRPPRTDREGGVFSVSSELTEKRGGFELVPWLPPIYPRNLPFATAVVVPAVWFVTMVGVVFSNAFTVGGLLAEPDVVLSVAALLVGQLLEIRRDHLRGGYESASPYAVVETPARQAFFVAFVLFVTPGIGVGGADGVLAVVVLVKLLVEWSAHRATEGDGGRLTNWLAGPESAGERREPVCVPDGEPDVRLPTDNRAVLYTGAFDVLGRLAPFLAMPFIILWFLSVGAFGDEAPAATVLGVTLVVFGLYVGYLAAEVLTFYLRFAPLEYQRYGDRLVAYDTLVDEPQWATSLEVVRDVQVVPDRLPDRLFGTRTIGVTTGWSDDEARRILGPVRNAETLVEALELPVRSTELEPLNRLPAAVVVGCLVAGAVALGVLAVGPWISPFRLLFTGLVYGTFGIPFAALVLRLLWNQAYPDRRARD
ncbi:DUF6498-containing protein [Halopiger xanaduensis]|uniref:Uncharacterized protein n=1 Tax=Halopiger xanaduensis (strain DSM 18323 / JCM 14033 / SH-6) TaxID=797210 RepID=F8D4Y5_HALXS|nr:DUF6498-containing protein [Halopiger xanaduensis]AEH38746.1 hypothetical protein Halxa_4142 [Halopiger xanaduensis SH-6]